MSTSALSEVGRLRRVVVKHARDAFVDGSTIAAQWQGLNFSGPPDPGRAVAEYEELLAILQACGARVDLLPRDDETTLDSIYVRDASIVCARGLILCSMGKPARTKEPAAVARAFSNLSDRVSVIGAIELPGCLEGGDVVWIDSRTIVVGHGYRTNAEGIRQLRTLLGTGVEVIEVPLPHWRGQHDVMHLMSLVSPVDRRAALVYSPLLPVPFREWLLERDFELIDVDPAEFDTMAGNVLALAPRLCVMLAGNPRTRRALERAGVEVIEYEGHEISRKGAGGPTCLTRPIARDL